MSETPLHFKTITEIAEAIAVKQLSPVDVTTAMLERIAQLDGRLLSYATVMAEHAMAAAQQAEQEIKSGTYRGAPSWCSDCGERSLFYERCPHDGSGEGAHRPRPYV